MAIDKAILFQGKVFDVVEVNSQLMSGKIVQRQVVTNPMVVHIVAMNEDGEIYLVKQIRPVSNFPIIELPAGKIDHDELPKDAANRELQEEIGFSAGTLIEIGHLFTSPGWSTEYAYVFLALDLAPLSMPVGEDQEMGDEDEEIEVIKAPIQSVLDMIVGGEIVDSKTIAAVLLTLNKTKQNEQWPK